MGTPLPKPTAAASPSSKVEQNYPQEPGKRPKFAPGGVRAEKAAAPRFAPGGVRAD